jgi:dTDP-glucose 4,6-dehydratase
MCNAYGPWQFPEKLIPLTILNGLMGRSMPVYGTGNNVREWIYVDDAARALATALLSGRPGESYLVGTGNERTNIDTVRMICHALDRTRPDKNGEGHERLIRFVADRPGHDARYAIDSTKIRRELGWAQSETGESGMERTVKWYIENESWWRSVRADRYDGERLGLSDGGRP